MHLGVQHMFFSAFKVLRYGFFKLLLLIATISTSFADNQTSTPGTTSDCYPEIVFYYNTTSQSICLSQFAPGADSCADLEIIFENTLGIKAHFSCNFEHKWLFDSVGYSNPSVENSKVKANVTSDEAGFLKNMQLFLGDYKDSLAITPNIKRNADIPENLPQPSSNFFINKTSFSCTNQPNKAIIVDRIYTYPVGYGKREPTYNYPELKMFHCGGSVQFPTSESVKMKGIYINEYHVLEPYKLKYQESKDEMVRKVVKQKPKKVRKRVFKFKPL